MRFVKLSAIVALTALVFVAGLSGQPGRILAQEQSPQHYMIHAGSYGEGNIEYLSYSPVGLKIHQGDTITWHFHGFHNVHFDSHSPVLEIFPVVDGQPLPQINPEVAYPTLEDGGTYTGGDLASGLSQLTPEVKTYSVVFNLPPGSYVYTCDIHPGMAGVIEVVADDVVIPDPGEVAKTASKELSQGFADALAAVKATLETQTFVAANDRGTAVIHAGTSPQGRYTTLAFFPQVATIIVGQKVTWNVPGNNIVAHQIASSNFESVDYDPIPQEDGPPIIPLSSDFFPLVATGEHIGLDEPFNSPLLIPGGSYSLIFDEPGIYPFYCPLHPNMNGVVVVEAAE